MSDTRADEEAEALLYVRGLSRSFGRLQAVNNVGLDVTAGRITAVIGPNGAGKTTLFNLVTGRLRPETGFVRFDGRDITRARPHRITRLGLARSFQISSVLPALTVWENVLVAVLAKQGITGRMLRDVAAYSPATRRCRHILERLALDHLADEPCQDLAYGDRRKVEVGMMLALEPKLMLLDEPTAGMGPAERRETGRVIAELAADGRYTVVLTEHDVDLVFDLAHQVVVMHQGEVIANGTPEQIGADTEVRRAYLGDSV
jgi:branched-chain amino acid transport system ATP-binding protein